MPRLSPDWLKDEKDVPNPVRSYEQREIDQVSRDVDGLQLITDARLGPVSQWFFKI